MEARQSDEVESDFFAPGATEYELLRFKSHDSVEQLADRDAKGLGMRVGDANLEEGDRGLGAWT